MLLIKTKPHPHQSPTRIFYASIFSIFNFLPHLSPECGNSHQCLPRRISLGHHSAPLPVHSTLVRVDETEHEAARDDRCYRPINPINDGAREWPPCSGQTWTWGVGSPPVFVPVYRRPPHLITSTLTLTPPANSHFPGQDVIARFRRRDLRCYHQKRTQLTYSAIQPFYVHNASPRTQRDENLAAARTRRPIPGVASGNLSTIGPCAGAVAFPAVHTTS